MPTVGSSTCCSNQANDLNVLDTGCSTEYARDYRSCWWIGGQRIHPSTNSRFVWKTDLGSSNTYSMAFTKWSAGEPNFNGFPPESCLELVVYKNYEWNDASCDGRRCYVCEINRWRSAWRKALVWLALIVAIKSNHRCRSRELHHRGSIRVIIMGIFKTTDSIFFGGSRTWRTQADTSGCLFDFILDLWKFSLLGLVLS
jgi:hypothetical protein